MSEANDPVLAETAPAPRHRSRLILLPLFFFAGLAALFLLRLFVDAGRLPSALIGRQVPHFDLPAIAGLTDRPGLADADLRQGHVTVVNIFASWCAPCRQEHAFLLALSRSPTLTQEGVTFVGIAYKDSTDDIRRFLGEAGDPFSRVGNDASGRVGIDFGVYGVPETYIVKGDGKIAYKLVGPMASNTIRDVILPEIEKARQ